MKLKTTILILSLLACGCGHSKPKTQTSTALDNYSTTPLAVAPAKPDPSPVILSAGGASQQITAALTGVRNVMQLASKIPSADVAISMLQEVESHLLTAQTNLSDAKTRIDVLQKQIDDTEAVAKQNEDTLKADNDRLKKIADDQNAASNKQIQVLQEENTKLQYEQLNRAKSILFWSGLACLLGAGAAIYSELSLGFLAGWKVAAFSGAIGAALITVSLNLNKIVWWCEAATAAALLCVVLWTLYHTFHHDPNIDPKAVSK